MVGDSWTFVLMLLYMGSGCSLWSSSCQFFYPFKVPLAIKGPLQKKGSCKMYYDPAPWRWIRAVPVRHIIGRLCWIGLLLWLVTLIDTLWCVPVRAPLMKCYLDSKDTGTIPSHLAKYREQYYKYGHADHGKCLGSKLYELNTFAWKFGRPMLE